MEKPTIPEIKRAIEEICRKERIEIVDDRLLENVRSLALVNLVLAMEDVFELKQSLVSENAFSRTKSPFRTLTTLAEYIGGLL